MNLPAPSSRCSMSQNRALASSMAALTAGDGVKPPDNVSEPSRLMKGRTPSFS